MTDTLDERMPQPWKPEQDPAQVKVLGKLAEELGECSSIAARCIIQGYMELEPTTQKLNKMALQEEIADVMACMEVAINALGLDRWKILERANSKSSSLGKWIEME